MAVTAPQQHTVEPPVWPALDNAALDSVRIVYYPEIDYLYVFLYGEPLPAVWDPRPDGDTWVGLRLVDGDWVDEVVAILGEHFRLHAARVHPRWEPVLAAPGAARRAAVRELISEVAAMPLDEDSGEEASAL